MHSPLNHGAGAASDPDRSSVAGHDADSAGQIRPRVQIVGELHGHPVAVALPAVVRTFSRAGFSIESPVDFPIDARHLFEVRYRRFPPLVVQARAVQGFSTTSDGEVRFVTRFVFTPDQPRAPRSAIDAMVLATRALAPHDRERTLHANGHHAEARLPAPDGIRGDIVTFGIPFRLREFGLGGCSIETGSPLEICDELLVRIDAPHRVSVSLRARVVHSRREPIDGGAPRYISGLQFVSGPGQTSADLARLLEQLITGDASK
jgi:hypothetical protein